MKVSLTWLLLDLCRKFHRAPSLSPPSSPAMLEVTRIQLNQLSEGERERKIEMFFQLKIAANRRQGLFREDFGKFLICGRLHFVLTCEISRSLVTEGSTCSSYLTGFVCLFVYLFVARTCNRYAVIRACADKGAIMFRISCSLFSPAPTPAPSSLLLPPD